MVGTIFVREYVAFNCLHPTHFNRRVKKRCKWAEDAEDVIVEFGELFRFGWRSALLEFDLHTNGEFDGLMVGVAQGGHIFTVSDAVALALRDKDVVVLVDLFRWRVSSSSISPGRSSAWVHGGGRT